MFCYTKTAVLVLLSLFHCLSTFSQEVEVVPPKTYVTAWATSPIAIDGVLDDEAWQEVAWGGDFVGHDPEYNVAPSQETQFKILYDAKYLYVGIRAWDTEPEKIVKRMSRRDGFDGDWVEINIDSYFDKRTAFSFSASVSGVKGDEYVSGNGNNWDSTWDPIWYLQTSIDDKGWVAEFKIPLSQLRFANKEHHTWGIQLTRRLFREQERSTWQPVDPNAPGWVHLFGELKGIKGIKPQKQLELLPYVLASTETYPKEEGNPFREKGSEQNLNGGIDAKIGITSDITLDLTVNPDFGQVEADPSQVNLSAFELFFRERRPFFLEGNNVLSFRTSGGANNLYYSRRIGRSPQGYIDSDYDYAETPNQTALLGAAKITGKNAKGFSWGIMESFTDQAVADAVSIDTVLVEGDSAEVLNFREEVIEPYTNYFVARAQQELNGAQTVFGAVFTDVRRFNNQVNGMDLLHDKAQTAGVDLDHNFNDRKYGVSFKYMYSHVEGTQGAIYETQTSYQRSFQRTDNAYKEVDSTRTSLLGTAGTFSFGKRSGNWRWSVGSNYRSPELELDDIGFLRQTDMINNWVWTRYRVNKVTKYFRSQFYRIYSEHNMDFGGVTIGRSVDLEMGVQFKNFWRFSTGTFLQGNEVSNADLRGGPSIVYPGGKNWWYWFGTNNQKALRVTFNNWYYWGDQDYAKNYGVNMNITLRPIDALRITLSPSFQERRNDLQYISDATYGEETRYVLGTIQQQTYRLSMRCNFNITPNLTLEFWGQPFISRGQFSAYKRVVEPNAESYGERFALFDAEEIVYNEDNDEFDIFETGGEEADYSFSNPNFNIAEFRSNLVMRWEYVPGSTLFLVWANNGSYWDSSADGSINRLQSELFNLDASNTFLVKYTYRFIL